MPNSTVGIFTTDRNLVVRTWDPAVEQLTGKPSPTVLGKPLPDLFPEIGSRGLLGHFHRVLETGAVEILASAFHGYLIDCSASAGGAVHEKRKQTVTIAPLREESSIIGLIVTIEDVTARSVQEQAAAALADEDWRTRKRAVETLAQQGADDVVKRLLASLRSEHRNPAVLNSALQVLSMSGWNVVQALTEFLHEEDVDLRIYAALALGEHGSPAAIAPLVQALADSDENVRYHAIEALGKLRASEATEALIGIVRRRDFFLSFAAIDALALIGDPQCTPVLLVLLNDDLLKTAAAETLGKLGEISAVEPLARMLNSGDLDVPTAVRSLWAMFERYEEDFGEGSMVADLAATHIDAAGADRLIKGLSSAPTNLLKKMVLVIGWLHGEQVDRALTELLSESSVRRDVIAALLRHRRWVADLLIEQLEAEDVETRRAAATILGKLGSTSAVGALVRRLNVDPELTVTAADALARIGDRSAYEALLQLLGHDKASVRQAAVGAINSLGHPDTEGRVVGLLQSDNSFVRESAVRIAGYFAYPDSIDLLIERCGDSNENVQRAAIEHLPYLSDPRVASILVNRLHDLSPRIRAAAAQALGEMNDEGTVDALAVALKDADAWVRYYAARSVARKGVDKVVHLLGKLAFNDESPFVRIAAIEGLGAVGAEAIPSLQPLVASDDANIAKAALQALGRTQSPEALPLILQAAHARDAQRRLDAAEALARHGGKDAVNILQWLSADEELQVADEAMKRLASIGTPEAIAALITMLGDERRGEAAATTLAALEEKHWPAIAAGLEHPHPGARSAIVKVFGKLKHPSASQWIARALNDQMPGVRLAAVNALARSGNTEYRKVLAGLAQQDPDLRVRQAARKAMEPAS